MGERTPVFLIAGARPALLLVHLRIAHGRVDRVELTGIARLEDDDRPRALDAGADSSPMLSARLLPRFASDAARDPRAPQNLYPIGGLEAQPPAPAWATRWWSRRAIEAQLHLKQQRSDCASVTACTILGRVLGTQDAMPLEFWVAVEPGQYLQLDDVVVVETAAARTAASVTPLRRRRTWCAPATRAPSSTPTCSWSRGRAAGARVCRPPTCR